MQPLVSVVLPTFNRPDYLRQTLVSAMAQTIRDIEIIVMDNGSDEDPTPIIASFGDPRVRLHRHARNIGQTPNFLAGISMAQGKYVVILGDDDIWKPTFLEELVAPMELDDEIIMAFCDHDYMDAQGQIHSTESERLNLRFGRHLLRYQAYGPDASPNTYEIGLVYRGVCIVSCTVMRREAVDWSKLPPDLPYCADIYLCYLMAITAKKFFYVPNRLVAYRFHAGAVQSQMDETRVADARWLLDFWNVFRRDKRVGHEGYFLMLCARQVVKIMVGRARRYDFAGFGTELKRYFTMGVLDPRAAFYQLAYVLHFKKRGVPRGWRP